MAMIFGVMEIEFIFPFKSFRFHCVRNSISGIAYPFSSHCIIFDVEIISEWNFNSNIGQNSTVVRQEKTSVVIDLWDEGSCDSVWTGRFLKHRFLMSLGFTSLKILLYETKVSPM